MSGSGAVLHTLNPRLHPDQVVWIADHAEDQVLFFDLTFLPLVEAIAAAREDDQGLRRDDRPRATCRRQRRCPNLLCYEDLIDGAVDRLRLAGVRREHRLVAVLHVGHHRQPEGRAVQPPLDGAAHLRGRAARRAGLLGARRDPAGGADVPRQRLGPAVRRPAWSAPSWCSRARGSTASRCYELFEAERRHAVGRRADRLAGPARPRRSQRPASSAPCAAPSSAARPARRR